MQDIDALIKQEKESRQAIYDNKKEIKLNESNESDETNEANAC